MSIPSKHLEGNFMSRIRPNILSLLVVLLSITVVAPAFAGDVNSKAGTSAFPFLKIPVGARAVAMGGAFTGLANWPMTNRASITTRPVLSGWVSTGIFWAI
jgi:hypothetical protein